MKVNSNKTIIIPNDFNWKNYIELNKDLNHITNEKEATDHYVKYGYNENRKYKYIPIPSDFNWKNYIDLNEDLKHLRFEQQAKDHYVKYGYNENRKYKYIHIPSDFNWKEYVDINEDLYYIKSEQQAKHHYVKHGYYEDRKYSILNLNLNLNDNKNNILNMPYTYFDTKDNKIYDNVTDYTNNSDYVNNSWLNEKDILITKFFNEEKHPNPKFLKYKITEDTISILQKFILVVDFFNGGGGTTYFLNQIVSKYKYHQTFVIIRSFNLNEIKININEEYDIVNTYNINTFTNFLNKYKYNITKIFVNHTYLYTDELLKIIFGLKKYKIQIIGITHDYSIFFKKTQPYYYEIFNSKNKLSQNVISCNNYDLLITQNKIHLFTINQFFKNKIDIVHLPDVKKSKYKIDTTNSNIVVGIIGNIINIKGKQILEKLIKEYKTIYSNKVKLIVFGYTVIQCFDDYYYYNNIYELNELLIKHRPNMLLELSIWPETYSYTLSLSMLTKLPIIYLKKQYNSVVEDRLQNYDKAYSFTNYKELSDIIFKVKQNYFYTIQEDVYYSKYWDELFIINKESKHISIYNTFKYNIKPYMIYFPQFHEIYENNINFYKKYTDIQNLDILTNNTCIKQKYIETPSISEFNLENICDYDLTNTDIIQKQIDIITQYAINGFAMYYYWFSINTYTNKNMIMEKVINQFFNKNIDLNEKKIFFIWANEDWSNNVAFGQNNNNKIENIYNEENFTKNILNLMKYFKNDNYLKIDNKPVFFVFHTWLINNIEMMKRIFNEQCIQNGFNGIHFAVNNINHDIKNKYNNDITFYINFNYKKSDCRYYDEKQNQIYLDYKQYFNDQIHFSKCIQTICFDFDNRARLTYPNNIDKSTICVENTEFDKIVLTNKIVNLYKDNTSYDEENIGNLLLVNAFNEWGEKMTFEPSNEYGYYNLNLLTDYLTDDN